MSQIKVLLVDDEAEFTVGLKSVLSRRGLDVKIAADGLTALPLIAKEDFDVVVLDVKMPGMDGFQVLKEITRLALNVPVILLTGHYSLCEEEDTWKGEAYACVFKPCPVLDLVDMIVTAASRDAARPVAHCISS